MPPNLFAIAGVVAVALLLLRAVDTIIVYLRPSKLARYRHTKNSQPAWALVTGASDGIGKAFAHSLAESGFNVVIHGRNPTKLAVVLAQLESTYPLRSFRVLLADATNCAHDTFKDIVHRLSDLHLTILVNNVGSVSRRATSTDYRPLDDYTHAELVDTVALNVLFPTLLTRALTPTLAANGPALIVFLGSVADLGLPLVAPYGASKTYLGTLAESLALEMKITKRDIEVLHVRVGPVTGVANVWRPPSWLQPHATTLARTVLDRVGCGRAVVVPYVPHALKLVVTSLLPRRVRDASASKMMVNLAREGPNSGHEKKKGM
ncbi:putative short chain dehydrogenase protein [Podospora conica]|nr:putative short chain dehydrogenase protein [Schizothecium conicum]